MPASVQPDRCVEETSSGAMLSTGPYGIVGAAARAGVLTAFYVGHAAGPEPCLVPALIERHAAALWAALQAGGVVYVCGGSAGFGPAVAAAMQRVIELEGHLPPVQAELFMLRLRHEQRYLEDLAD